MKKTFIFFLAMATAIMCVSHNYSSNLDINNVNALIKPIGNQFNDWDGYSMYYIPIGEGTSTIYISTLWIGGFDTKTGLYFIKIKSELNTITKKISIIH